MYFESVQAMLEMDGHGMFVWSAYAVTAVVLVAMVVAPLRRRRRLIREIGGAARREQGQPGGQGVTD
ncbi:MAG: heme exporter protein CcmD [Halioglobus sp.]|nr:heme exporter protein CcmD [Halioglobus sp.]